MALTLRTTKAEKFCSPPNFPPYYQIMVNNFNGAKTIQGLFGQQNERFIGRVSLILNPSSRSGLEFRVSELGLYFQIEKKSFTKII